MNTESKLRLQAYLDNEVSSSEARQIASWIARDAEAQGLYDELRATKSLLVPDNEQPALVPESRDFYWSKIQRQIERTEQLPAAPRAARPWWIRLLVPAVGAAALALFVFTSVSTNPGRAVVQSGQSEISQTDSSITFYSPKHRMTVVWIPSETDAATSETVADWDEFE